MWDVFKALPPQLDTDWTDGWRWNLEKAGVFTENRADGNQLPLRRSVR